MVVGMATTTGPLTDTEVSATASKSPIPRTENGRSNVLGESAAVPASLQPGSIVTRTETAADANSLQGHTGTTAKRSSNTDDNRLGKGGSPEEEGDKGRRPCDMCRKRKVRILLFSFLRSLVIPDRADGIPPRSNAPRSTTRNHP